MKLLASLCCPLVQQAHYFCDRRRVDLHVSRRAEVKRHNRATVASIPIARPMLDRVTVKLRIYSENDRVIRTCERGAALHAPVRPPQH